MCRLSLEMSKRPWFMWVICGGMLSSWLSKKKGFSLLYYSILVSVYCSESFCCGKVQAAHYTTAYSKDFLLTGFFMNNFPLFFQQCETHWDGVTQAVRKRKRRHRYITEGTWALCFKTRSPSCICREVNFFFFPPALASSRMDVLADLVFVWLQSKCWYWWAAWIDEQCGSRPVFIIN